MQVRCSACGKSFEAQRRSANFCGPTCRQRASRQDKHAVSAVQATDPTPISPPKTPSDALFDAVKADLVAAGRLDTALGQQALRLAVRMRSEFDTGSAIAALSKELRAVLAEALKDSSTAADSLDELALRRQQKAAGA